MGCLVWLVVCDLFDLVWLVLLVIVVGGFVDGGFQVGFGICRVSYVIAAYVVVVLWFRLLFCFFILLFLVRLYDVYLMLFVRFGFICCAVRGLSVGCALRLLMMVFCCGRFIFGLSWCC